MSAMLTAGRTLLAACLLMSLGVPLRAADVELVTYYPSPDADYKDLVAREELTVGVAGAGAATLRGSNAAGSPEALTVENNQIGAWNTATSHGGFVTVTDTLSIQNSAAQSLFHVDATNNRVGVGTSAPRTALEIVGDAKGMIVAAHHDTVDWTQPWADIYAQINTVDNTDSAITNGLGARFAATFRAGDYRFCTMHIDASPLAFQTIAKAGITQGQGKGQVVIRGVQITTDDDLILIVGESAGDYEGVNPVCRANAWSPLASSMHFKKDIQPLDPSALKSVASTLASTPIYRYRYKGAGDAGGRIHTGFVAEEAPAEIVSSDRKRIDLGEQMGFLLAAAKAESDRLERIEHRLDAVKEGLRAS